MSRLFNAGELEEIKFVFYESRKIRHSFGLDWRNCNFRRCQISNSSFEKADLRKSDFSLALLLDCNGKEAVIDDVNFLDFKEIPEEWKGKITAGV